LALAAINLDICVVDSMTHEWAGEGGYLEIKEQWLSERAGDDWKKRDSLAFAAAAKCKPEHMRLVNQMLRMKIPLILCFRGKEKVRMSKGADGKTTITTDDSPSAIQDSSLIFEMLIAGEVFERESVGGYFRPTKVTHPALRACLPKEGEQFGIKHGELIAKWANGGTVSNSIAATPDERSIAAQELWTLVKPKFKKSADFQDFCRTQGLIDTAEELTALSLERIKELHRIMKIQLEKEAAK
jgi:hypothetical protein